MFSIFIACTAWKWWKSEPVHECTVVTSGKTPSLTRWPNNIVLAVSPLCRGDGPIVITKDVRAVPEKSQYNFNNMPYKYSEELMLGSKKMFGALLVLIHIFCTSKIIDPYMHSFAFENSFKVNLKIWFYTRQHFSEFLTLLCHINIVKN